MKITMESEFTSTDSLYFTNELMKIMGKHDIFRIICARHERTDPFERYLNEVSHERGSYPDAI